MAKRIVLGNTNNSGYGLFVSKDGVDVIDGSGNVPSGDDLIFNSVLGKEGGWTLVQKGQGSLTASGSATPSSATVAHSVGFIPQVLFQWCFANEISGGVATVMRLPFVHKYFTENDITSASQQYNFGCGLEVTSSNIKIYNHAHYAAFGGSTSYWKSQNTNYTGTIYYAYLIFEANG